MNKEQDKQDSMRKSRRRIRNLAINNSFQLWVTLTMAQDRQNDEKTLKKLQNWLKCEKRRVGTFDYLLVPERHKDGALHFHGLIGQYRGELVPAINPKTKKPLKRGSRQVFNIASYKLGFTDVEKVESPERIAAYITKYITKDMPTLGLNKKRYWASRTLNHPRTEENPEWFAPAIGQQTKAVALEQGILFYFPTSVVNPAHSITGHTVQGLL